MTGGKANINQTLTLPVNMYFDLDEQKFQEKKVWYFFMSVCVQFYHEGPKRR